MLITWFPAAARGTVVPEAAVWYVTGYEFEASANPPSSGVEPISGTATLTVKEPGVTWTLTYVDLFDEEESFELTLQGDRLVGGEVEDLGGGEREHWRMVIKIVDENTLLLTDMFAVLTLSGPRSFDAVGAVLTREPLPAVDPSAWAGDHQVRAFLDFGTDSDEGIAEETGDEFDTISLMARGGGSYDFLVEGEDEEEFTLTTSGNVLRFEEISTESHFLYEDANWRKDSIRFSDHAYVLQLGGGRIFVVGSGSEVARWTWKPSLSPRDVLDWADLYLGIAGGDDETTDPVPVADVWHVTGYEFEAFAQAPYSDAQAISGTATLTPKIPGATYTLTFDLFGEEESFDLTLEGNRLVSSSSGGGHHLRIVLQIVDEDTLLLADMYSSGGSFDTLAGVLTREPLRAADPAAWAGGYPVQAFLDFGTGPGGSIVEEFGDEFDSVSLVARGDGTYGFFVEGEEEFELSSWGNVLRFEEFETEPTIFSDRAYVHQLGGGRILIVGAGSEVAGGNLSWADLYMGIAGGDDSQEPEPVEYSDWVSTLGLEGADAEPDATPFPDGLPNLVRYALNLGASPAPEDLPVLRITRPGEGALIPLAKGLAAPRSEEGVMLTFEFRSRKGMTGVILVAETSRNLSDDWEPVPESMITRLPDADEETARHRVGFPMFGEQRRFIRLAASRID